MSKLKVMTIFGTRPEAIKMAPLVLELQKRSEQFEPIVTVTAQHREMLDQVLSIFDIEPDYDLNIMKKKQSLAQITTRALEGLDELIKEVKPDMVLVHGDTTTTFAASLAAFYNEIPVGHVEAGLRTWNKYSPFPEEINRQATGIIADLHFAPTNQAQQNLLDENKSEDTIFVTGNTAIDALNTTVSEDYQNEVLRKAEGKRLVLMTAHRRENLGENMDQMFRAIRRLAEKHEDVEIVYPVHLNPVVQETAQKWLGDHDRIQLIDPLEVIDFHNFASNAHLILTDSGGVQEEAPSLGVPVLVLRDTTERPEGIDAGTLKLAGTDEENIFEMADLLLSDDAEHAKMAHASNPYGDGQASRRIADTIRYFFKETDQRPDEFK
ncbi:UDP-N-acetylglucosamine 2-epimerase (non-hydrolyzing) [Halalkalibacillus sediminis]|uniref:UDP-N-acetylglucosamine 2-epimerase (non-hydrolyzing) n=1 Tax=Halalkalibacillus sediminis TaxID=2018042 RepID=A0A2I0QTR4_9BACI|nr:UDP-N-acetylglucosamine 2-epimerase (non-hydrolyzing) [Halalkalibacillus sediminis]PKR77745.1 UDP-N-acetylglucosamine 2-epimerase (non-hydrolyzing) [Halalkalibacillus sediminis]